MDLESLTRHEVRTRWGVVPLWSRPEAFASSRPMVVAITGMFAASDDLSNLPRVLGLLADACLVRLPELAGAGASDNSFAAIAAAIDEALEKTFPDRPVVLLGVSIGAVIAMAAKAPSVKRIVAVEPTLVTDKLWPVIEPLRQQLAALPPTAGARRLVRDLFGVDEQSLESRSYVSLIEGLQVPTDVVLGEFPLFPERPGEVFPSLVDAPERARLAARPGVRLHLARGAGHNVQGQAPRVVKEVLLEACRRASAAQSFDLIGLDEPLVEATPLTARRVLHWGPGGELFARAYLSWNPNAAITLLGEDPAAEPPEGTFEAVALGASPRAGLLDRLNAALAPGGCLIVRWTSPSEAPGPAFARRGLAPPVPADEAGTGVWRVRTLQSGQPPAAALELRFIAFASLLMDIRTRLPARGLRSDPDLVLHYQPPPFHLPPRPREQPKVLVLQRPAEMRPEPWLPVLAHAIRDGWITVLEYDDHPLLIAEAQGRPNAESDMRCLGYMHAVQTASPPLVEAFRPYNPETRMFPNAVFELLPFPNDPPPPRVIYAAVLRGAYGVEVARSLAPAVDRFPDTEFVVIGDPAVFEALPTDAKHYHPYMSYEAYLGLMSTCAISLSPIEALPLRDTKSDAKFLDASRAGLLTIASPTIYDRVIEHGVNGLIAPQVADWAPMLIHALEDPGHRRAMARRAWDYVRAQRMFADQVAERRDWYLDLWSRRAELNEALMRRMPGLREAVAAGAPSASGRRRCDGG